MSPVATDLQTLVEAAFADSKQLERAETQLAVGALLALAAAAIPLAARTGALAKVGDSISANQKTFDGAAIVGVLAAATFLHQEHFAILMMTTEIGRAHV